MTEIPIYQVNRPAQMIGFDNFIRPVHIGGYGHFNQPAQNYRSPVQMGNYRHLNQPVQTPSHGRLNQPGLANYGNFFGQLNYDYSNGQPWLTNYGQPIQPPSYGQLNRTAQLGSHAHYRGPSPTTSYGNFNAAAHIGSYGQFNSQTRMANPGHFYHSATKVVNPPAYVDIKQNQRFLNAEPKQPTRFLNSEPQPPARFLNSEPRHRFTAVQWQTANAASNGQQHHQALFMAGRQRKYPCLLTSGRQPTNGRHHPYARPRSARNTNGSKT